MGGYGGGMGGYGGGMGGYGAQMNQTPTMFSGSAAATTIAGAPGTQPTSPDLTGSYLGMGMGMGGMQYKGPRIVPNMFDNTLLVQGTPQEWEQISRLLEQLDVPPRQVLIDAKIYEVDLTGQLSAGVSAYLQKRTASGTATGGASRTLSAFTDPAGIAVTAGLLVLRSHELLGLLTASDTTTNSKVISAPSIIATDSIPAILNVGQEVPVLTSQAVAGGLQQSGNSLFTNTISNRSTGVTLNILARVNSSGVVTLVVNQDVSTPQAPTPGGIQSPSFSKRAVQTQVTVQDGDTVAIGGIIQESDLRSSGGVMGLHRIPILGAAFGSKSRGTARTELIIFLTPRVIYDTNQITDASEEIKGKMRKLRKEIRDQ
jgi:general secretion pathway protein D